MSRFEWYQWKYKIPTIAQVTVDTNSYILDIINKFIINEAHIKHNAKGRSQRNK